MGVEILGFSVERLGLTHMTRVRFPMTDTYPDVMDFCAQADDRPTERHPEGIDEVDGAPVCAEQGAAPAQAATAAAAAATVAASEVRLVAYEDERQLDDIMSLVDRDLSEPYSIFTYRYFLHNWPGLCFVVSSPYRQLALLPIAPLLLSPSVPIDFAGTIPGNRALLNRRCRGTSTLSRS